MTNILNFYEKGKRNFLSRNEWSSTIILLMHYKFLQYLNLHRTRCYYPNVCHKDFLVHSFQYINIFTVNCSQAKCFLQFSNSSMIYRKYKLKHSAICFIFWTGHLPPWCIICLQKGITTTKSAKVQFTVNHTYAVVDVDWTGCFLSSDSFRRHRPEYSVTDVKVGRWPWKQQQMCNCQLLL